MIKAIFLDMDDTLIVNKPLYVSAELMLYHYLSNFGILRDEAKEFFDRIDKENYKTHGYSKTRMPASFEATLRHFVPDADAEAVAIVRGFAEDIFTAPAALKPGVVEAIGILAEQYKLYIVTAGDEDVQRARYDNNIPFKDKISRVFIVPEKNESVYETVLCKLCLKAEEVVMIGDSLRSDIVPAVKVGLSTIWIEADNWSRESVDKTPAKGMEKRKSILEAAEILVKGDVTQKPAPKRKADPKPKMA